MYLSIPPSPAERDCAKKGSHRVATNPIPPLQGACSLASEHRFAGERSKAPYLQFRLDAAKNVKCNAEKEAQMFEPKASCRASRVVLHIFGNPKGSGLAVAFFCLLFLARQEK
jgi:hypothetical protein